MQAPGTRYYGYHNIVEHLRSQKGTKVKFIGILIYLKAAIYSEEMKEKHIHRPRVYIYAQKCSDKQNIYARQISKFSLCCDIICKD